jgi:serine/threonine-protein kinase
MGDVWLAMSHGPAGFSKLVVVKQLRGMFADEPRLLTMFLDEARTSARLNHPHIVQTHEVGQDGDAYFIAMEYLDGQSLQRLRRRTRDAGAPLPLALELPVLLAMLRALDYAHELEDYDGTPLRLVHRDISPQNVIVTYDGQVKLLDFGIAKARDSADDARAGTIQGKMAYMAPEQARGDDVDRRADVFSMGVLLAEAITGERYWPRIPHAELYHHLVRGELPNVRERAWPAPEALLRVCEKALAFERDARFASAAEMVADIEAIIAANPELRAPVHATSTCVAEVFAEHRAKVRSTIDAHMRALRAEVEEPVADASDMPSLASLQCNTPTEPMPVVADSPSHPTPSSLAPVSSPMAAPSTSSMSTTIALAELWSVASFRPTVARGGAAALLLGAALGMGLYLAAGNRSEVQPATAWPSTPPAAAEPSAVAVMPVVEIVDASSTVALPKVPKPVVEVSVSR